MAQTTFSGPILAGTIKNTIGTTVGTDVKNTGSSFNGSIIFTLLLEQKELQLIQQL